MAKTETIISIGKRKSSVARLYMKKGSGTISINHTPFETYFPRISSRLLIEQPLVLTEQRSNWDIYINVMGGGLSGQAGATRHAIARGVLKADPETRKVLKKAGLLTRDAREVERKKPGRSGARKRYQFSKR